MGMTVKERLAVQPFFDELGKPMDDWDLENLIYRAYKKGWCDGADWMHENPDPLYGAE